MHTGGDAPRCTVHLGAWRCKKGKNAVSISVLDLASFLSAVAVLPKVQETFNRAGMHLGAGAHSVQ